MRAFQKDTAEGKYQEHSFGNGEFKVTGSDHEMSRAYKLFVLSYLTIYLEDTVTLVFEWFLSMYEYLGNTFY